MPMKGFVRATTPTFTFTIKDKSVDLTQALNVYVTLEQTDTLEITKTGADLTVESRVVKMWLTQRESMSLKSGQMLYIQINWTYLDTDGVTVRRASTEVGTIAVTTQLLDEILDDPDPPVPEEVNGNDP